MEKPSPKTSFNAKDSSEDTLEVSLEDFAFWQAQMAHAVERAENNSDYTGKMVYIAYEDMKKVLEDYHQIDSNRK